MALTERDDLADRMRSMSLHGLSNDAWGRYTSKGSWDYRILAPGYKYNLTDVAAALGLHQLARAEELRQPARSGRRRLLGRPRRRRRDRAAEGGCADRVHSWHLFQIKLRLERLSILDRDGFLEEMRARGVAFSVHWRPLHLHPYYRETFGWKPEHLPVATDVWRRTVSLPIFPAMTGDERDAVVATVREICRRFRRVAGTS